VSEPATPEGLPDPSEKARVVRGMFDRISNRYDLVNRVMTFGMDVGWRRRAVGELRLPGDALVADLACGTGDLCNELQLPLADGGVDGATCGFALRNVTDLIQLFAETARVLRPGGRVAFLETSEPDGRVLRAGHALYFRRIVPLIGGALSDGDAYRYLPRSTAYLPEPERLIEMLGDAGFERVERTALGGGVAQMLVGTRR
jgi:demethylmenaquinone methyltransferase / 2-methoxy-6-polyprenyl-1,4-benzoquinol methylase